MKVDPARRQLVVASSALEPDRGGAGVFRFELASGQPILTQKVLGKGHLWNDLALLPEGVLVTDSVEGTVYRLGRGSPERLLAPGRLDYPNGIAVTPDGRQAFVAHLGGIVVLDLASGRATPLPHPSDVTLVGIDGLYLDVQPSGARLIGIQNGVAPVRLIALALDRDLARVTGLTLLAARSPAFPSPTTGAVAEGELYFLANAQIEALSEEGRLVRPLDKLRPVVVRALRLP